ncbi:hypothetical protein TWF281_007652 [Arthrobotrys megalospora]
MFLLVVPVILTICSISHGFLLAQSFASTGKNKTPIIKSEVYENTEIWHGRIKLSRPLKPCNPRSGAFRGQGQYNPKSKVNPHKTPTTLQYLVAANWEGGIKLEAIAFYSTRTCNEDSMVLVIRFIGGKDTAEVVQLTGEYVPQNLVAWQAIDETSSELLAMLALSMEPGSVFIPTPSGAPTTETIYCTGLVQELVWTNYDIASQQAAGKFNVYGLSKRITRQLMDLEGLEHSSYSGEYDFRCTPILEGGLPPLPGENDAQQLERLYGNIFDGPNIEGPGAERIGSVNRGGMVENTEKANLEDYEDFPGNRWDSILEPYKNMASKEMMEEIKAILDDDSDTEPVPSSRKEKEPYASKKRGPKQKVPKRRGPKPKGNPKFDISNLDLDLGNFQPPRGERVKPPVISKMSKVEQNVEKLRASLDLFNRMEDRVLAFEEEVFGGPVNTLTEEMSVFDEEMNNRLRETTPSVAGWNQFSRFSSGLEKVLDSGQMSDLMKILVEDDDDTEEVGEQFL